MKVKDLIKALQKVDPEKIVVMAKDEEGNGYSPLEGISEGVYEADSSYSGEYGTVEDFPSGKKAICLHPRN